MFTLRIHSVDQDDIEDFRERLQAAIGPVQNVLISPMTPYTMGSDATFDLKIGESNDNDMWGQIDIDYDMYYAAGEPD